MVWGQGHKSAKMSSTFVTRKLLGWGDLPVHSPCRRSLACSLLLQGRLESQESWRKPSSLLADRFPAFMACTEGIEMEFDFHVALNSGVLWVHQGTLDEELCSRQAHVGALQQATTTLSIDATRKWGDQVYKRACRMRGAASQAVSTGPLACKLAVVCLQHTVVAGGGVWVWSINGGPAHGGKRGGGVTSVAPRCDSNISTESTCTASLSHLDTVCDTPPGQTPGSHRLTPGPICFLTADMTSYILPVFTQGYFQSGSPSFRPRTQSYSGPGTAV